MNEYIVPLLYSLGLSANYVGFGQLADGVAIAAQEPEALLMVTKWLYPEIAARHRTNWKAVERNIRLMLSLAWSRAPRELERMAGCPLTARPTPAQFIAILTHCCLQDAGADTRRAAL